MRITSERTPPTQSTEPPDEAEVADGSASSRTAADRDLALAHLAAAQHGLVERRQLIELGFVKHQIAERSERTLFRVAPSVWAVGHPGLSRRARAAAALLHCGDPDAPEPVAGLSMDSASRVWEMESRSVDGDIHVSLVGRRSIADIDGVQIHRPSRLRAGDLVLRRGFWVTTPERTLIDLLPRRTEAQIAGILERMVTVLGRDPDDLHAWAHALPRTIGRKKLIRALDHVAGPAVIRSELEALFREICRESALPLPLTNHYIGRDEVDAVYVDAHVAIELDSWKFHGGRWQFHQDRRKGLRISRNGYELIRLTWWQLKREREEVVETLLLAIERGLRAAATIERAA